MSVEPNYELERERESWDEKSARLELDRAIELKRKPDLRLTEARALWNTLLRLDSDRKRLGEINAEAQARGYFHVSDAVAAAPMLRETQDSPR